MRHNLYLFFFLALIPVAVIAAPSGAKDLITLNIPETVITEATSAILPLDIDVHSKYLGGDIKIVNISELRLTRDHLACRLGIAGRQLAILTQIGGHEIRLDVGSLALDLMVDALIRFDPRRQILFIKPVVSDFTAGGSGANRDIGQALVAVFNGREFPLTMQQLDPLITRVSSKTITINTTIANIQAMPGAVQIGLVAQITAQK